MKMCQYKHPVIHDSTLNMYVLLTVFFYLNSVYKFIYTALYEHQMEF